MHYEVWPGQKSGDPYEIREITFIDSVNAVCGKTVEFVDEFVKACIRCKELNGDKDV